MFIRFRRMIRYVAATLVVTMLFQIISPLAAWALTSPGTQPEVWGYQPPGSTDNVSLGTGAFNYSIPVTSIPEYPMNISYSSGGGMDDEASMFGFGVNGSPGAITRNVMGIPDDINGAKTRYMQESQVNWSASAGASIGLGSLPVAEGIGGIGAAVNLAVGYDNYKGFFGSFGLGLSLAPNISGLTGIAPDALGEGVKDWFGGPVGLGQYISGISPQVFAGVTADSRYGATASIGADLGLYQATRSVILGNKAKHYDDFNSSYDIGIRRFSSQTTTNASSFSQVPNLAATLRSLHVGVSVPIPGSGISLKANFSSLNYGNMEEERNSYGFMYMKHYDMRNGNHQADMGIEGEYSFDKKHYNNPVQMSRDFFKVNCLGVNGVMQMYQDEYGIASRNYQRTIDRDIGVVSLSAERREIQRWPSTNQASFNKAVDIMKLLKKGDDSKLDFDKVLFTEKELQPIASPERTYSSDRPKFKMKGDLAGEFLMESVDGTDDNFHKLDLMHIPGTGGFGAELFGFEKEVPMYYPALSGEQQLMHNNAKGKIRRSTNVQYKTVGEVLSAYTGLLGAPSPATALGFNFHQSFYSHYNLSNAGKLQPKNSAYPLNNFLETFSILDHLDDLSAHGDYFDDLIAGVRVENANGMTYLFDLPVFTLGSKNTYLKGKGQNAPESTSALDDYVSFMNASDKPRNRSKSVEEKQFYYPYAWLITAIVGDDYIDFDNVPGPSDGDLGYWVKFRYTKTASDYRTRTPFKGLEHLPASLHLLDDDMYTYETGEKEIYVVSEIESPQFIAKYNYHKRFDGVDAANEWNGLAENPFTKVATGTTSLPETAYFGNNYQFTVSQIDLYKKHASADNSKVNTTAAPWGTPVKSTIFKYDYSVCPGVTNNYNRALPSGSKIMAATVPYHIKSEDPGASSISIGEGKLTLRKIQHIAYNADGSIVYLPSTEFQYGFDFHPEEEYNPSYDSHQKDIWGNYSKLSRAPGRGNIAIDYYTSYCEVQKEQADKNAQAWALSSILLPSGGQMNIEFEANDYGYVENRTPHQMRHIHEVEELTTASDPLQLSRVEVDISDLAADGKTLGDIMEPTTLTYGEVAYFPRANDMDEKRMYVAKNWVRVVEFGSTAIHSGRTYQWVTVMMDKDSHKYTPFVSPCRKYLFTESPEMAVIRETSALPPGTTCLFTPYVAKYENLEKDSPVDAAIKLGGYIGSYFKSDATFKSRFETCYGPACSEHYEHWSFFRTPIYKNKYTGSRVKTLEFSDNFQYATTPSGGVGKKSNTYRTRYYYDEESNGTGRSAMVATIEPGGGDGAVINMFDFRGASFIPSPMIMSSKTSVGVDYEQPSALASAGDIVSREKGVSVYEFYTPKEVNWEYSPKIKKSVVYKQPGKATGLYQLFGMWTTILVKIKLLGKTIKIRVPAYLPITLTWRRKDQYHLKHYAYTDYTDIYGTLKRVEQRDVSGKTVSQKDYTYYQPNLTVPTYEEGFSAVKQTRPGRMDQVWGESYMTQATNTKLIPWILYFYANTEREFIYTHVKNSYVPPILREVKETVNGVSTLTSFTGFDAWTGQAIESETFDSYGNKKIVRSMPAYWVYPEMGPSDKNPEYTNQLTTTAATFRYLNEKDEAHLLDAALTTFTKSEYDFVDYLRPVRNFVTPSSWKYFYTNVTGTELKDAYLVKTDPRVNDNHVKSHRYSYKPLETWVYEVGRNTDGTYKSFTAFDFASGSSPDPNWKAVNTNTKWDIQGHAAETKDILDKYASAHFGYNFTFRESAVANAGYKEALYESAENTYQTFAGAVMLQENKVQLADATIFDSYCPPAYISKTSDFELLKNTGVPVYALTLCEPVSRTYDEPVARINAVFAHDPSVTRALYVYLDDDGRYTVMTSKGEPFYGFAQYQDNGCTQLFFDPTVFSVFELVPEFENKDFDIGLTLESLKDVCAWPALTYPVPDNNCPTGAHTGRYGFELAAGKSGTYASIKAADVPAGAWGRKFKAMAWVHQSSPQSSELRVELRSSGVTTATITRTLAAPFIDASEWQLLYAEVEPSMYGSADEIVMYLHNPSAIGSLMYDDLRLQPYQSDMQSTVYDHKFSRVTSNLDMQGMATWLRYDARDRVIESAGEIEHLGRTVLGRSVYNDQKKN